MRLALREAERAVEHDDVPIGAVVVRDGEVIGAAGNERELREDPTAHAETLAIREAAKRLGGGYLAINKGQLARLPVRCVDRTDSTDRRRHDRLVELAKTEGGRVDIEIDELVYGLYRLTRRKSGVWKVISAREC